MYRSGRPNCVARVLNRGWAIAGKAGVWPGRLVTVEVRGRRTGRVTSFPLLIADYEGERYLVPMLGEGANWVQNVRAAEGHVVLRHGRRETAHLEEVDIGARAPILKRYLQIAPAARALMPVDRHAPLAQFAEIAAQYPVFRVTAGP